MIDKKLTSQDHINGTKFFFSSITGVIRRAGVYTLVITHKNFYTKHTLKIIGDNKSHYGVRPANLFRRTHRIK